MKAMKPFFFAAALVVAFGTFAIGTQAQSSSSNTSTSGGASSGASIQNQSNDGQTGAWSNGGSNGTYNAKGKNFSAGGANSGTHETANFSLAPGSASSFSGGSTGSNAFALGAPKGTGTNINGSNSQGNYAGLSTDSMNGVNAGNTTSGQYQAKGKGTSELMGAADTLGNTQVTANQGPTTASTSLNTFGASDASASGIQAPKVVDCHRTSGVPQSSVQVAGNGGAGGQSYLSNGSNYAGAMNSADMSYTANGKTGASGSLGANGGTSASLTPTTATSSSNMSSYSAAHGH